MTTDDFSEYCKQWNVDDKTTENLLEYSSSLTARFIQAVQMGSCNAVHSSELQKILHTDNRTIEKTAFNLRVIGLPVCGNNHGYYFASDLIEGKQCFKSLYNRAFTTMKSLEKIQRTLEKEGVL